MKKYVTIIIFVFIALILYYKITQSIPPLRTPENTITQNGRTINFKDFPKNDLENIISNYFICEITGEFKILKRISYKIPNVIIKNTLELYKDGYGVSKIIVNKLDTFDNAEDLLKIYNTDIESDGFSGEYTRITTKFKESDNIENFKIVRADYEYYYTDKAIEDDRRVIEEGNHIEYFILGLLNKNWVILREC